MTCPRNWRPIWRWLGALVLAANMLGGCDDSDDLSKLDTKAIARARAAPVNAASLNCKKAGGILTLFKRPDGSDYGLCNFSGGNKCEEWAMLLNYCPRGGIDLTDYPNEAARYCTLNGGRYHMRPWGESVPETCELPRGVTCNTADFYKGTCGTTIRQVFGH